MRNEHKDVQTWIKQRYSAKYGVEAEVDKENKLPNDIRRWYQPDVIMRAKDGRIKYIIEVESDPTRKSIVGACILADASLKELNSRAQLYFVIYHQDGIRQIHNFRTRVEIAKRYCGNLHVINVVSFEEFKKETL
jgi:hypothetical protein